MRSTHLHTCTHRTAPPSQSIDDEGDATSWKCKAGTGAAQWTVRLQKPTTVQRVRVVFADRLAPAAVMVFLASEEGGEGAGSDVAALNFVPVAARTVTQPDEVRAHSGR